MTFNLHYIHCQVPLSFRSCKNNFLICCLHVDLILVVFLGSTRSSYKFRGILTVIKGMGERISIMVALENKVQGIKLTPERIWTDDCCPDLVTHILVASAGETYGLTSSDTLSIQFPNKQPHPRHLHTDAQTSLLQTLKAAPPWMMDLIKIPKSVPVSRDLFPFKLTPRPAEPESFRGISKVSCSVVSGERAQQSGSPFCCSAQRKSEGKKVD